MTAFPDLVTPFGIRRILRVNVETVRRENLVLERVFRSGKIQHIYEIPWSYLSPANRATLDAFMVTCRGRILGDISYTDPWDGLTYTCRLDQDDLSTDEYEPQIAWSGNLRLVEVADFKALKAAVDTFPATVPFQPPYRMTRRYSTVIEGHEDFSERRYEDRSTSVQLWSVGGDALVDDQADDLLDCWEGNCGPWREFEFTEPETSTPYDAHFAENELVHTLVSLTDGGKVHSIRTTVEESK